MSLVCKEHGKARTLANLLDIGNGEFRCKPDSQCKASVPGANTRTAGASSSTAFFSSKVAQIDGMPMPSSTADLMAAGHTIIYPEKAEMCHAHGKMRSPQQLYQVMTERGPKWECLLETRCKIPETAMQGAPPASRYTPYAVTPNPYSGVHIGGIGGAFTGVGRQAGGARIQHHVIGNEIPNTELCSVHGKRRSNTVLEQSLDGSWRCRPNDACKIKNTEAGNVATCFIHQKLRKMEYLVADESGNFKCSQQYQCQTATK
eukprot:TRINITY_DN4651_c1_g2_i1.p1 TRINITY_DN4651_c1_g2~~TRINITY_DN4651_c1_g2_i1.p1  ORF type:complete len:260 (+),score=7.13 TRINITY_DN4651_c1_g2_i1:92-871(+)